MTTKGLPREKRIAMLDTAIGYEDMMTILKEELAVIKERANKLIIDSKFDEARKVLLTAEGFAAAISKIETTIMNCKG